MAETGQESGPKRWLTRGWAVVAGVGAALTVIVAVLTNIKTIVDWFESPEQADIQIRDLIVGERYPVDLYDFSHQAPRSAWARTIPPLDDKGYIAQVYFRAEKKGGDVAEDCIVQEMHGAKPMWKRLEQVPPPNSTYERDGQLYVQADALAFIGSDNYYVGSFRRGKDQKDVNFEVFFREKKSIRINLACRGRNASRTNPLQDGPRSNSLPGELNEPVNTALRVFRARGHPWLTAY
jgi:hypothetical protein